MPFGVHGKVGLARVVGQPDGGEIQFEDGAENVRVEFNAGEVLEAPGCR